MKTIHVTPYYKYLESVNIIKNRRNYSYQKVINAIDTARSYKKPVYNRVTEEERNELKKKYPNLYK